MGPGPVLVPEEAGVPNEKEPVVDGLGGSFSGVRPNEKDEDVALPP